MKLKIKEVRKQKGMTIRELAKRSGVSIGCISELEHEEWKANPTILTICKLAEALEVKPEDLYEC